MHIEIHIDGTMEPAGAAEPITQLIEGVDKIMHYLCLSCLDLFAATEGEYFVHDCYPGVDIDLAAS